MSAQTITRIGTAARWSCIFLGAAFILLWAAIAYLRLVYPYEVEWMEGAMMDHAVRLVHGKPIYTAPSIDFVAWLYPPLYYYAVAAAMKVFGITWFAGRIVSILSTLATALMLGAITKKITGTNLLAFLTFALYLATYHATGFYFDIVRNDAFFVMLLVALAYSATVFQRLRGAIITGIVFSLAVATKQQATFFLPPLALWLWFNSRRNAVIFVATAVILTAVAYFIANSSTDGWLAYYLLRIPGAKRANFVWVRMLDVFPHYAFGAFTASSLALFALIAKAGSAQRSFWGSNTGLLAMMTLAALAAGAVSLGNEGGYANVMMPFAAFVTPFIPIAVSEFGVLEPRISRYLYFGILFQLLSFMFDPLAEKMLIASPHQREGGDAFFRELRATPGDVYIPYHGFIASQAGKPTHAHILAALDVLRMHDTTAKRLQRDMESAFSQHRYSAVIMEESLLFGHDSVAHYTFSRRMIAEPNVYLTRVRDDATRPEFLFVPK